MTRNSTGPDAMHIRLVFKVWKACGVIAGDQALNQWKHTIYWTLRDCGRLNYNLDLKHHHQPVGPGQGPADPGR